jgi:GAF domain-containing protein
MKRRSSTSGKTTKPPRRKKPKQGGPRARAPRGATPAGGNAPDIQRLVQERDEALEQQAATSEVLQVISSYPDDLQPVFATMLEKAVRICEAKFGTLYFVEDGRLRLVTAQQAPVFIEARGGRAFDPVPGGVFDQTIRSKQTVQIADLAATKGYTERHPTSVEAVELGGIRTVAAVPMLKDDKLIGLITIVRQEVRPFTDKQVELVTNFAAQAVIAIENARLLDELRQRTTDLAEALEQQTAASQVLQIISSSPGELLPVFKAMLENATRICEAKFGVLYRYDDNGFEPTVLANAPTAYASFVWSRGRFFPQKGNGLDRLLHTKTVIHSVDEAAEPVPTNSARLGGARSQVMVPMLHEDKLAGAIAIYRQEVRPFTDKQIELVKNFAAQAVIAIENARLLNELRQRTTDLTERTADLTEALEQQTATSEVLQVISSSPGDLEPVFETMLKKAVRICDAGFGNIHRWDGEAIHLVATHNTPPAFAEARRRSPNPANPRTSIGRMVATKEVVHVVDASKEPGYAEVRDASSVAAVELGGVRTALYVPMLKENELVGAFTLSRQEVRPFTDKQIELVKNFAAQAVIAIENARLLNELRQRTNDLTGRTADLTEALRQQTATSEVLQVISGSPGDLQLVFQAMLEKAVRICDAKFGSILRWENEAAHLVATHNAPPGFAEARRRSQNPANPKTSFGRMVATKAVVHVADAATEPGYVELHDPAAVAAVEFGGQRTALYVPMLKETELVGALTLSRQEVRPFTDKQIELVKNFAAQAVIAIENARLLNELRQSLEQQTAAAEVLQVISRSPGDLDPVFRSMLENAIRICDAQFGNIYRWDGKALLALASHNTPAAFAEARERISLSPGLKSKKDPLAQMIGAKQTVHTADQAASEAYADGEPLTRAAVDLGGVRTLLCVPLLKDNELVGAFTMARHEVRPFTDKQIELVENFAAQAVIAIENTRLLKELRERTDQVEKLNRHLERRVADQVGEIERMGRLRRFLPPQVADLIVASGSEKQLESHRREITALFCDLRGFTGFTEAADAEDVMALLRDYHAAIGEIIIKYNGTLERYAGDGVMVVFNDPVPVENPALQAVLMALETREAISALTSKWRRFGHDIGFGIGIAHGYATLGTIGFEGRFDYAAIGTVSNVASRLCDEAKPGQILISPRVLVAVEKAVTVEPVGEFELKGIRRPLAAYNVVGAVSPQRRPGNR